MKEFKLIEVENEKDFNPVGLCANTPLTQSFFYGEWHRAIGHKVRRFKVEQGGEATAFFQLLKFPLPFKKSLLYIPYGPVLKRELTKDLAIFFKSVFSKLLREEESIFLRADFYPFQNVKNQLGLLDEFFAKAPFHTYCSAGFQPRAEWMLRIDRDEKELLQGMGSNKRQGFSTAKRKGVEIKIIPGGKMGDYFEIFFNLLKETARNKGFAVQNKAYYESIFKTCAEKNIGFLTLAMFKRKILVADLVLLFGEKANWVFSGTTREHKEKRATYLSLWESILESKKRGALWFNFGAVASEDGPYKNWQGFSDFKKRFGGVKIEHTPFYDVVYQSIPYLLYKVKKRIDSL